MSRLTTTISFAIGLLMLTGCSGSGDAPDPDPSTPDGAVEKGTEAVARCLTDQGWDVVYDEVENSITWSGTSEEQAEAYDAADAACTEEFGEKSVGVDEFTDAMWKDLYAQEAETAECLRDQGIDVPTIPTYETFVEQYQSTAPWTSYEFVVDFSESTWRELNRLCPQPEL